MIPELGLLALSLALCLSIVLSVFPLLGAHRGCSEWMSFGRSAAVGQLVFISLAFSILAFAFVTDDFSVRYVASNSSIALPIVYKLVAVWGGHEGSMLFWLLILAIWTYAVAMKSYALPKQLTSRTLAVLGVISAGFLSFTIFTSNPFERLIPAPADGIDLNPLLQDPGMVVHPPMLYPGFVGMAVPFAFAVAGLLAGQVDRQWARHVRRWTLLAWAFLTAGIAFGSAWAYYEIGWGGWWFWDAVENASFMPWLIATALIHSLAVTERRGLFKSWSILLALLAFSLVLLGGFLTRSGIITSVHSFASDPSRGVFILALMVMLVGGALILYSTRARSLVSEGGFKPTSREAFLLANNVLLVIATSSILLGTLYPLFLDTLELGSVSVGRPYYDIVFPLTMLPLAWLLGLGMHAAWSRSSWPMIARRLKWPAALAAMLGIAALALAFGAPGILTAIGVISGLWVIASSMVEPVSRMLSAQARMGLTRAQLGMILAHAGVGVFIVGATVTSAYNIETDRAAKPGEQFEAAGFDFIFRSVRRTRGPNYIADEGEFELRKDGDFITNLHPQRRIYDLQNSPMTEAAIEANMLGDVFLALGNPLGDDAWSVRIRYKPLIRFVWSGALLMALGAVLAVSDKRSRMTAKQARRDQVAVTAASVPLDVQR